MFTYIIWDLDRAGATNKGGVTTDARGLTPREALDRELHERPENFTDVKRVLVAASGRVGSGFNGHLGGYGVFDIMPPKRFTAVERPL